MKIHTLVVEHREPFARGRYIDERFAEHIRTSTNRYLDFFSRHALSLREALHIGDNSMFALEARSPDLTGEIIAMARGSLFRLNHLEQVIGRMDHVDLRARAHAMCGDLAGNSPICIHPDMPTPDNERWGTLLSVGINTEHAIQEYVAGTSLQLAQAGLERF